MTQRIWILIQMMLLLGANLRANDVRLPAEWEPQQKVWLTWFGQERRDSVSCDIVKALQPNVKLTINVESDAMKQSAVKYMTEQSIDASKLEFVIDPYIDFFVRDYAMFVKDAKGAARIVDFVYSAYGRFPQLSGKAMPEQEAKFGVWEETLSRQLQLPIIKSDYYFEGGGIESNGRGTLLVIRDMATQRNPGKSIVEIENELKRTLGARKIIWLEKGLAEDKLLPNGAPFVANYYGGGANMHVDELARFVNETTVVLPHVGPEDSEKSPVDKLNAPMFEANFRILQSATTADGKRIKVVRIPMPEVEQLKFTIVVDDTNLETYEKNGFKKGDTIYRVPAASYATFFVSNNVVLIPKYWKEGMPESQKRNDEEARKAFEKLFPRRQVIQIFTLGINRGGGGIHCATNQLPS